MVREGYKQTEMGMIPEDWSVVLLSSISKITRLAGYEYSTVWNETPNGEIIALRGFNIGANKINNRDIVRISNQLSMRLRRSRLYCGDVVYPCVGTIGNAAVVEEDDKYHIQQNIAKITPHKELYPYYLACYLMSIYGLKEVDRFNATSSQPNVLVGSLRKYRVILPKEIGEQKTIAQVLSDVDALIDGLEKLIAKKRDIKTATMQGLLAGKIRLPGFGEGKVYKQTELGEIPEDWEVIELGDVLSVHHGKDQKQVETQCGSYPILASGGEIGRTDTPLYSKPSVLIGRKGTIDKPMYMEQPFWTVDTLFYTEINEASSAKFLYYKFALIDWYSYNEASGVPSLNAKSITKIPLTIPTIFEEQQAIATVLSDMDEEILSLQVRLNKTKVIKKGVMQELLTGNIRLV